MYKRTYVTIINDYTTKTTMEAYTEKGKKKDKLFYYNINLRTDKYWMMESMELTRFMVRFCGAKYSVLDGLPSCNTVYLGILRFTSERRLGPLWSAHHNGRFLYHVYSFQWCRLCSISSIEDLLVTCLVFFKPFKAGAVNTSSGRWFPSDTMWQAKLCWRYFLFGLGLSSFRLWPLEHLLSIPAEYVLGLGRANTADKPMSPIWSKNVGTCMYLHVCPAMFFMSYQH